MYAARQQRLGDALDVVLSGEGQFAGRALLSSEQCSYGGEDQVALVIKKNEEAMQPGNLP